MAPESSCLAFIVLLADVLSGRYKFRDSAWFSIAAPFVQVVVCAEDEVKHTGVLSPEFSLGSA